MKINKISIIKLLFFFIIAFTFISNEQGYAHQPGGQKHGPITCKLPEDYSLVDKILCENARKNHKLCKLEQWCLILEMEEKEKIIGEIVDKNVELKKKLGDMTVCTDITFNHKASKSTKVHRKPSSKSKTVVDLNKGEELLFISPSSKDRNWYFVLTRKGNSCNSGYISQKFVIKKEKDVGDIKIDEDNNIDKSKIITLISPKWTKKDKLIVVEAPGIQTVRGWVDESKINEIIIDEKVIQINSDSTFSFNIFVKKEAKEVRIIGNKNGKKIKSIIFEIKTED